MTQHIAQLVQWLGHERAGVRHKVATALARIGTELQSALPALIRLLTDEDSAVRAAARQAVEALDPGAAGLARTDPGIPEGGTIPLAPHRPHLALRERAG